MAQQNLAAFLISGNPSVDANGNRMIGFAPGIVLALTLEKNPAPGIASVRYELFDPNDDESPLCSLSAEFWSDYLKFSNGQRAMDAPTPNGQVTITIPSSGLPADGSSWILRCRARTDQGREYIFERGISLNVAEDGWREPVPTETTQFQKRGWAYLITLARLGGGGGGGGGGGPTVDGISDNLGGGGQIVDNLGGGGTITP